MHRSSISTTVALACVAALAGCSEPTAPAASAPPASTAAAPSPPAVEVPAVPTPPPAAPTAADPVGAAAKDSAATDPKGTLNKEEESKSMPMAGHGNNHSSPALEPPKKQ